MAIYDRLVVREVTVYVDIFAPYLPERRLVLESELEAVFGPVVDITVVEVDLASDDDVDMLEEGEIKRRANQV